MLEFSSARKIKKATAQKILDLYAIDYTAPEIAALGYPIATVAGIAGRTSWSHLRPATPYSQRPSRRSIKNRIAKAHLAQLQERYDAGESIASIQRSVPFFSRYIIQKNLK